MDRPLLRKNLSVGIRSGGGSEITTTLFRNADFILPEPGIYTMEGPNQCGKSILIKSIVGALPKDCYRHNPDSARVEVSWKDAVQQVSSVREAHALGLAAVFQEESLTPSMTIGEHVDMLLSLHAATSNYRAIVDAIIRRFEPIKFLLGPDLFQRAKDAVLSRCFHQTIVKEKESAHRVSRLSEAFGGVGETLLDKFPSELSGGARAIARILIALCNPNIKILFLDEAFSHVDRTTWPKIVQSLINISKAEHLSVVAVTHLEEEILQWQPTARFIVRDMNVVVLESLRSAHLVRGIPTLQPTVPIYVVPSHPITRGLSRRPGRPLLITSKSLRNKCQTPLEDMLQTAKQLSSDNNAIIVETVGNEEGKSWTEVGRLVEEIFTGLGPNPQISYIFVAGAGALLNVGCLVAGLIYRGRIPVVVVPTNLTSIADVAIGSKSSVNVAASNGESYKNALGLYQNPSAVVLDSRFVETLPAAEKRNGLIEPLKHAILQDPEMFKKVSRLIASKDPNPQECYEIAVDVMKLKGDILGRYPWEDRFGRILRYGHLFAHAAERASKFAIHHSKSVLWGILVEAKASAAAEVYEQIKSVAREFDRFNKIDIDAFSLLEIERELAKDPYCSAPYDLISVSSIGMYGRSVGQDLVYSRVPPDVLRRAMADVTREMRPL